MSIATRVARSAKPRRGGMSIATRVARSAKPRRGGMSSRSLGHSRWSVGPKSPIMPLRRSGGGNPKSEARNPKQIQIDGNGTMGKREAATFLRRRRELSGGELNRRDAMSAARPSRNRC